MPDDARRRERHARRMNKSQLDGELALIVRQAQRLLMREPKAVSQPRPRRRAAARLVVLPNDSIAPILTNYPYGSTA
jgi:hypothetical protein